MVKLLNTKLLILVLILIFIGGAALGAYYFKSSNRPTGIGFLQGKVTIGPICPVERVGVPCNPTPEMYTAHPIFVYNKNKSAVVKTITGDANGNYKIGLPAGEYIVDANRAGIGGARNLPQAVHIESGKTIQLNIDIDTGIR